MITSKNTHTKQKKKQQLPLETQKNNIEKPQKMGKENKQETTEITQFFKNYAKLETEN